ncbi:MdtA/MuxA family multidrug efflux RND transporter periplasmic adaptor subunit [Rhodopila sp.]|uniref:MdtA/MuxA family multidrug efflux RND transporter periplasmic adaptor subunit n=1 Tax=Rhodopila sp. TaxID=2480087 RepID=UPI003D0D1FD9
MDERVDRADTRVAPDPASRETQVTRPSRRGYWVLTSLILIALLGGGWYLWAHRQAEPTPKVASARHSAKTAAQPVGFATIDTGDVRIMLNELGTVTSLDTVTVLTQINGELQQIGFNEGQVVKKGDFLAQIDPRPYQAALEQAQGTLARDQGLLAQAQSDLKRFQTLGRQDSIAQQQLDDQRFLVQQDTGLVQTDQGAVDAAKVNLAYCHIVSPIDGQVGLRLVDLGNYVQTSSTSGLVVITQMQPISVLFSVPEDNLPDIIQRVRAGATLPVEAYDRANTRLLATGQLGTIDNVIDTTTGTLKLRAMFANPDELLYPNQFVNARLLVNTMKNTVRVPVPAVQRGEPGTFVYLINANDTVSVRPIKVGPTDGGYEAVLSGLKPGDRVVTDGTDRLRDGAAVSLPAARGSAAVGSPGGKGAGTSGSPPTGTTPGESAPNPAHQRRPQPPQ